MTYSFKCPACGHVVTVDSENDVEAFDKMMEAGGAHSAEVHPDMPPMSEDQMREMVRTGMKKGMMPQE